MAEQPSKASPLNELCSALPSLPMRLQEVGRFVAANDYDATTRSMRCPLAFMLSMMWRVP